MYTVGRDILKSWNICALEDCTTHQFWELSLPFFNMFDSKQPRGRVFYALNELFPGVPNDCFTLHSNLKLHGGSSHTGDVVSFLHNGVLEVGQLKEAVGINVDGESVMYAIISKCVFYLIQLIEVCGIWPFVTTW